MKFQDLLQGKGIDLEQVLVFRHRPQEPELRKVLPWLAAERPDVFNAYQQSQKERAEKAITRSKYVASFIGQEAGSALFVGLYAVNGWRSITREQYWEIPANDELRRLGGNSCMEDNSHHSILWFDLVLVDFYPLWKGKLIVDWPPPDRAFYRKAQRPENKMPIRAILEESALEGSMPEWNEIDLRWEDLKVLPNRWKSALCQWRGIYYIFDVSDGKGYVGSAYGKDNLLGRWTNYGADGHGGNRLLQKPRKPQNFRFTILELVSPNLEAEKVIRLEATWKERLHTRHPLGLNDN